MVLVLDVQVKIVDQRGIVVRIVPFPTRECLEVVVEYIVEPVEVSIYDTGDLFVLALRVQFELRAVEHLLDSCLVVIHVEGF